MSEPTPASIGRYRIEAKLGEGGMGVVWRAHDPQLRRDVALKVLPDEMVADDVARARLLREARAAAALNHPNILTVYDVGEADGRVYIATEYVPGRSLADGLSAGGMSPAAALRMGGQIASALAHAHERGIVHRDVKPSNVLVTPAGDAKVLDFGIATRVLTETFETRSLPLTVPGALVGTPIAMAPEQWRGVAADTRSDVWAFGALLQTMLTGRPPFRGDTVFALSTAICTADPEPLPDRVAPGVRAIVTRCLEREPERRYGSAAEVSAALHAVTVATATPVATADAMPVVVPTAQRRLLWVVALSVVVIAAALLFLWRALGVGHASRPITSLAVLPLESVSGDADQRSLGDGMTGELITRIAQLGVVRVISRNSAMRFRDSKLTLSEIGRQLGVDALVEGTIEASGGRVKVSAELVRAATEEHVWGRSYERPLENVLALEDEVAEAIAHELGGALAPRAVTHAVPGGSTPGRAPSAAVVQAYLRGRDQYQRWTPDAERRAVEFFDRALSLDSTFAPALAARGTALLMLNTSPDTVALARTAIDRALALDPTLGEAHAARAKFLFELDWNWAESEREFRRAIELNPNDTDAHHHYSHLLLALGRPDESRREAEIMLTLDPLAPASLNHMGWLDYELGNFDRAVAESRKTLELDPNYRVSFEQIADIELARRRLPALRSVLDEMARSGAPVDPSMLRLIDAAQHGRQEEARTLLAHMVSPADRFPIAWTSVAAWHALLGQRDEAFAALDSGFVYRDYALMFINVDPAVADLRTDARYGALRRRMRLPE